MAEPCIMLVDTASNMDSRTAELKNITDLATINNLSLNLSDTHTHT